MLQERDLTRVDDPAIRTITGPGQLDLALSRMEHEVMFAVGAAPRPKELVQTGNALMSRVYVLAATMIGADGDVDEREIETAEKLGQHVFGTFDKVEFRWICKRIDTFPPFIDVASQLTQVLEPALRRDVHEYLASIASADGRIDDGERVLLERLASVWQVEHAASG
jgi:uncharacterized tellurite resistance protein B-like protein